MLVRVKEPRIRIEGELPEDVVAYLRSRFEDVEVEDDDELVDWFETDLHKEISERITAGDVIKVYRRNAKMTQKDLAAKLGVKRPNVTAMERGKRPIGKAMADKLSKVFNVPREYFLR
jgi:DNA-binding XRE family transcriptional regulator